MKKKISIKKILSWLLGSKSLPFQYTHHFVLLVCAAVYTFSVCFNIALGVSDDFNIYLQMGLVPAIIWIWYQSRWKGNFHKMAIIFAYFLSLVSIPTNWLGNGGSSGPTYLMGMASLIYLSILLRDISLYRRLGQALIVLIPIPLVYIEYLYPELIFSYPDDTLRQIDLTVSFILIGFIVIIIMENYFKRFQLEREKAEYLTEQLRFLSEQDPLTSLYNRRGLDRYFEEKANSHALFSMVILDLDNFKHLNDQRGHSYGDEVLCSLSGVLKDRAIKDKGIAVRLGGEEFVLLLPLNAEDAVESTKKVVAAFSREKLAHGFVTFSAGVAQAEPEESQESLLKRADALLYKAKKSGRACILM
ncbi:GGDEF domain-containing protein [Marinomonas sp. 15G1-11]|uniref:diguanylate cyclase n=1 Tax=Marinomonas phaeophyticola TaxID=3004091 RepID=A0ABT4JV21_9GAMM|nr:GGDEF domain-containing protein [Marinomonas sp. 15G1-11]MCZ2721892.1 GGDEF domain-containing protein [Marinomonas sp. 15G1-11]